MVYKLRYFKHAFTFLGTSTHVYILEQTENCDLNYYPSAPYGNPDDTFWR